MYRLLYNLVLHTVIPPFLAAYYLPRIVFGGKYRRSLAGKLGHIDAEALPQKLPRPIVWFHAVSVGEVVALSPFVKRFMELKPDAGIVISTGTETGYDKARELIPEAHGYLFLPLDFPFAVNRVVERIAPDLFVLMETELWPNLIHILKFSGAKVVLANGRISDRSFPRYRMLRAVFASTLDSIDIFLMASETDAERIVLMNAAKSRVRVTGNTKFDAALGNRLDEAEDEMRDLLGIDRKTMTLVAGSTHPGERNSAGRVLCSSEEISRASARHSASSRGEDSFHTVGNERTRNGFPVSKELSRSG
jgi:3-deoxy-D-manno-octulosonic-acid transferase